MAGLTLASIVSHPAHPVAADVAGETILMSLERSRCYGLGEMGTTIWKKLESPVLIRDLLAQLNEQYEGDPSTIERDVFAFLNELAEEGLIEVSG